MEILPATPSELSPVVSDTEPLEVAELPVLTVISPDGARPCAVVIREALELPAIVTDPLTSSPAPAVRNTEPPIFPAPAVATTEAACSVEPPALREMSPEAPVERVMAPPAPVLTNTSPLIPVSLLPPRSSNAPPAPVVAKPPSTRTIPPLVASDVAAPPVTVTSPALIPDEPPASMVTEPPAAAPPSPELMNTFPPGPERPEAL